MIECARNPSSENALRHEMLQLCTNVENVEIYDDDVKLCLMIQGTCQGRISIAVDHAGSI